MKVGIAVEETLTYRSEVIIEQPSYMSDEELDSHIEQAEKKVSSFADFTAELEQMGFHVHETVTGFPSSPDDTEFEVYDTRNIKDDEDD